MHMFINKTSHKKTNVSPWRERRPPRPRQQPKADCGDCGLNNAVYTLAAMPSGVASGPAGLPAI